MQTKHVSLGRPCLAAHFAEKHKPDKHLAEMNASVADYGPLTPITVLKK
jgi:hypothetical protein